MGTIDDYDESPPQITSNSSNLALASEYVNAGIYSIILRDTITNKERTLQIAAINFESAKKMVFKVAESKFGFTKPEIISIVKAY